MNPEARGVTKSLERVVVAALESRFKLECTETSATGAAIEIAKRAVDEGNEYILAFGGDGLVNEVANGIAGSETTLGIIPGGTMNVFARNLGIRTNTVEATDRIISGAGRVEPRQVELSRANDRFFTFSCGCGFDAEAAAFVEKHKKGKSRYGEAFFYGAAFMTFLRSYLQRDPFLTVHTRAGAEKAVLTIALNQGPYAYFLGRPVRLAHGGEDLDLFILRKMTWWRLPVYTLGAIATNNFGPDSSTQSLRRAKVTAEEEFAVHVDGEPMPPTDSLEITSKVARMKVIV